MQLGVGISRRRGRVRFSGVVAIALALVVTAGCSDGSGDGSDTVGDSGDRGWEHPPARITTNPALKFELEPPIGAELSSAVGTPESPYLVWTEPLASGEGLGSVIVALDAAGKERWTKEFDGFVKAWPVESDVMVFAGSGKIESDAEDLLYRLDGDTGVERWATAVNGYASNSIDYKGRALVGDSKHLTAVDLDSGEVAESVSFDEVGNVIDVRHSGAMTAIDGVDVVVLNDDLSERSRFSAPGSISASYSDGKVLVAAISGVRLYNTDGAELATIDVDAQIFELWTVGDGMWAYGEAFGPVCGVIAATDDDLSELWRSDLCQIEDVVAFEDGTTFVSGAWGVWDAQSGRPATTLDGQAVVGDDGFFYVRLGECWAVAADSEVVFSSAGVESASMIDGGYVVLGEDPETNEKSLRVYA